MAGFIIINEVNIWGPARWVYKNLTSQIIDTLNIEGDKELIDIITLSNQNYTHLLNLDRLSKVNKLKFINSLNEVIDKVNKEDGSSWHKPEFFQGFKECIFELKTLIKEVQNEEIIDFNNKPKYIYSGKRHDI